MKRAPFTAAVLVVVATLAMLAVAAPCVVAAGHEPAPRAGWTARQAISGAPLLAMAASDPRHAWAVGPEPSIVATSDGGATWSAQVPGTTEHLYGVAFADATHGWAVGGDEAVVATSDGGLDWAPQTTPALDTPLIAAAARGDDCWAVGIGGAIIATTDAGTTWDSQVAPSTNDLYGVAFADADHGWAVGDGGEIIATTDGGAHWSAQRSPTSHYLNGVACEGKNRAWAVGAHGVVVATADGGAHWVVRHAASLHGDLYTVAFADARHGWSVGDCGLVLATTDGGLTWRAQPCPVSQTLTSVAFPDALHGFIAGTEGAVLTTARGGWSDTRPPVASASGAGWHATAARVILSARDGAGGSGVAARQYSLDHGATWKTATSFVVAAPRDHSSDGVHTFLYRAIDNAGNVGAARHGRVGIDTRGAKAVAKWRGSAVRFARVALRYYVADRRPGSATATVTIRIRDTHHVLVKKAVLRGVRVDAAHAYVFTCLLRVGTYRFAVSAVDAAGNRPGNEAGNVLTVRNRPLPRAARLLR
ncbi:MAG TPA: YCF48-related protein [Thermoleophilia bacterium]|nr:YCF48-related protein [Thermoleophilia bacterium]